MTFQDDINRMLSSAYADLGPPSVLGEAFGGPPVDPPPTITVTAASAYISMSLDDMVEYGVITEEAARAQGWIFYVPPPMSWSRRLRWRWQAWRERAGRKIGGWIAGVDLSERDEDW